MAAGHSYGEFVALHAAGSFDEQTLFMLSEARGRFMREGATDDAGTMAAIEAGVEELAPLAIEFDVVLANLNAPLQTVISGSQEAVDKAVTWCTEHGFRARRLPVACAFHSPLVAPAKDRLAEMLASVTIEPPSFPVFSNTTGDAHPDDPRAIASTLSEHLTSPVHWRDEITHMYESGARIFVEAGPKSVLSGLVGQILDNRPHVRVIIDQPKRNGVVQLLHGLATLASEGVDLRLAEVFSGRNVKKLDLRRLLELTTESAPKPTTWFVNGGRAIPATKIEQEQLPRTIAVRTVVDMESAATAATPAAESTNGRESGPPQSGEDVTHSNGWDKGATGFAPTGLLKGKGGGPAMSSTRDVPFEMALDGDDATARGPGDAPVDGSEDVMAMFQHVMQRFLDTQRSVMLAYLSGGQASQARPENKPFPAARPRPAVSNDGRNVHAVQDHGGVGHVPVPQARVVANGHATNGNGNGHSTPTNGHDHLPVHAAEPEMKATTRPAPPVEPVATPAPVVESPVAAATSAPVSEVPSRDVLLEMLLQVVSDRTGYPPDMLGLDADLEADLGIDSIKRVEISGTIVQSLTLPPGVTPDLERLTSSRTLNQVVDALVDLVSSGPTPVMVEEGIRPFDLAPDGESIGRFLVSMIDAPASNTLGLLARDGVVVIAGDARELGDRIAKALSDRGYRTVRIVRETPPSGDEDFLIATLGDAASVTSVCDQIHERYGRANALILLSALTGSGVEGGFDTEQWTTHRQRTLNSLLLLAQGLREDLENSSLDGGSAVLVGTALGGAFGSASPSRPDSMPDGALTGFVKTLAQEWPSVRARAIDFDTVNPATQAELLVAELFTDDDLAEVAYVDGNRVRLAIRAANFTGDGVDPIDADSVVLITGGARGITAEVAATLAGRYGSTFVLVGRTPAPSGPEPAFVTGLSDRADLRKAVLEHLRSHGNQPSLQDVEQEVGRILGEREVRETLARIGASARRVEYVSCDVRSAAEFGKLIDSIYVEYGRLDGVIHGAGIIEDKLIKDKRLDSFQRVISTKVDPALVLAAKLRPESLRFLVFFSSVSGRFGNRGQGDYAAANEILNKLAVSLDAAWPSRVVSINWGPWLKTGMVSPEVQRQFAERQVTLIPIEVGCRMLDQEIRCGRKGEAEVVVGGTGNPEAMAAISRPNRATTTTKGSDTSLPMLSLNQTIVSSTPTDIEIVRSFDVGIDHYLEHHRLDGRPVLPFAFASELMAETAERGFENLRVAEVRDIRLMNGLTFDEDVKTVHISAHLNDEPVIAPGGTKSAAVTISAPGTPGRMHYRSTVHLRPSVEPLSLDEGLKPLTDAGGFPMPVEQAYRDWLFHGPVFQRIVSIEAIGPQGASAWLLPSSPSEALDGAGNARWIVDPILVDGAFQMQVIWARMHWDVTLLPAEVGAIHRFELLNPADGPLRYELRIRKESSAPLCHADHFFFDRSGRLVGRLRDVVGAGSRELNRLAGSAR